MKIFVVLLLIFQLVVIFSLAQEKTNLSYQAYPNETKIGEQIWMTQNLNIDSFRNGKHIQQAKNMDEWINACQEGAPIRCYYMFDSTY